MKDKTPSMAESKEASDIRNDNSLIVFGSVNKTNETTANRLLSSRHSNSGNKFNL